jgi:hypothetical protein
MADRTYTPPEGYVTMNQAGEILGSSPATVRKRVQAAGLKTYRDPRDPRARLLRREDVEALASQGVIEESPDTKQAA